MKPDIFLLKRKLSRKIHKQSLIFPYSVLSCEHLFVNNQYIMLD